ncbi:S9 family peptidase [Dictyobacter aurantiacus]|uniref:Acylaminoacyl-peptidase n=1 Tax=Dictyobacter aurantiacus TaxID=1936993 RepID=A0A401ZKQ0_9CHLR|nr:S9 family peptidase [Dictyobacter aurantiacus]GCE07423.1 acylaminoacyl-peptidase [Dictyobacter aurantiacus]
MSDLSAEQVVDIARPGGIELSADGSRVAYVVSTGGKKDEHGVSALWVAPIDGSAPPRQFTSGESKESSPRWSPDGRQLAFLSDRAERGTAALYLLPIDGGEARRLGDKESKREVKQFAWSPGGGQIAFSSADEPDEEEERREKERDDANVYGERLQYARLRLLSLASNEVTTLVSQERHVADFVWHPRGTELAYVTWQTPELESMAHEHVIERIPVAGGEPQVVCRWSGMVNNLTWSEDGKVLFFIGSATRKAQSSMVVYCVDAEGGEPRRLAGGETNCIYYLYPLHHQQQVAIAAVEGLSLNLYRLDGQSGELSRIFPSEEESRREDSAFDAADVRQLEDGRVAVAMARGSSVQPPEVWAGIGGAGEPLKELRQLSTHNAGLAGISFVQQEAFYWTASDGLKLDGLLLRPPTAVEGERLPTVVLVHGGPYGCWMAGFNLSWGKWAQWLALAGYAVLMPNPRGGSGHGEEFAAAALGDVGGADYGDVMAAVDAAIERGIADPERLGIGGWSQGGFMSAWAVTQSDRFKAAIMGAGVSDWGLMVQTSDLPDFEQELGRTAPWDGLEAQRHRELSPITFASRVKTPVLILHGENDARVPVSQAIGFHRALRHYQVPTEMVLYPREPHGIGERAHQLDLLRRVRRWYDRWLRA